MKKMKILAVGLMLTLTGAVYAFTSTQASSDTCALSRSGSCCKPDAACCKDGSCPMCKGKKDHNK
jgi:hypothetical protein